MAITVIKKTKENMYVIPISIASTATATYQFQCDSTSQGGVVDFFIGGKTTCATI